MSDIIYNEIPNYHKDKWREVSTHTETEIKGFFGPYRWLSNFHLCSVPFEDLIYPSSENAYQAAKVIEYQRDYFVNCTPIESKKNWKRFYSIYETPSHWDDSKFDVMANVLLSKFTINLDLKEKLLNTGNAHLEEVNWWKDLYWGTDSTTGKGENNLGKLLMFIRKRLSIELG